MALVVEAATTMAMVATMIEVVVARVGPPHEWGPRRALSGGQGQPEEDDG